MPTNRTLKIKHGPGFQTFALANGIVAELPFEQSFTMDRNRPTHMPSSDNDPRVFQMPLKMFGRLSHMPENQYLFIGHMSWAGVSMYYVGMYNTATRKGRCEEIPSEQFLESHALQLLFGPKI